jgi:hypothetical protein
VKEKGREKNRFGAEPLRKEERKVIEGVART